MDSRNVSSSCISQGALLLSETSLCVKKIYRPRRVDSSFSDSFSILKKDDSKIQQPCLALERLAAAGRLILAAGILVKQSSDLAVCK